MVVDWPLSYSSNLLVLDLNWDMISGGILQHAMRKSWCKERKKERQKRKPIFGCRSNEEEFDTIFQPLNVMIVFQGVSVFEEKRTGKGLESRIRTTVVVSTCWATMDGEQERLTDGLMGVLMLDVAGFCRRQFSRKPRTSKATHVYISNEKWTDYVWAAQTVLCDVAMIIGEGRSS